MAIWAAATVAVSVSGCGKEGASSVPFRGLDQRQFAASESDDKLAAIPQQVRVIERREEWAEFAKSLGVKPPPVDFATEAVAIAFAGRKPTSGHSVVIRAIELVPEQNRLRLTIVESAPPSGDATLQVLTYPFDIVVFRRPGEWSGVEIDHAGP